MADGATAPKPTLVKTEDNFIVATWATGALGGLATGAKASLGGRAEGATVQMVGTWGSATGVLKGSNDGVTFHTLFSAQQNTVAGKHDPISATADAIFSLLHIPRYLQFLTSGGTGTNLTCYVVARNK